ncbi:MAG: PD40 domain-containing protein, partial [Theionarchaea archaeon]|nr:PD40 domain-containing protein [Theionarchaea archaeon]
GENTLRLSDDPANDIDPAWSPDGQKILFVSDRTGANAIFVMNADGTNQRGLTSDMAVTENASLRVAGILCACVLVGAALLVRRTRTRKQ